MCCHVMSRLGKGNFPSVDMECLKSYKLSISSSSTALLCSAYTLLSVRKNRVNMIWFMLILMKLMLAEQCEEHIEWSESSYPLISTMRHGRHSGIWGLGYC